MILTENEEPKLLENSSLIKHGEYLSNCLHDLSSRSQTITALKIRANINDTNLVTCDYQEVSTLILFYSITVFKPISVWLNAFISCFNQWTLSYDLTPVNIEVDMTVCVLSS